MQVTSLFREIATFSLTIAFLVASIALSGYSAFAIRIGIVSFSIGLAVIVFKAFHVKGDKSSSDSR